MILFSATIYLKVNPCKSHKHHYIYHQSTKILAFHFLKLHLLEKDLQDHEDICPVCHGLGVVLDNNVYGVKGDTHFLIRFIFIRIFICIYKIINIREIIIGLLIIEPHFRVDIIIMINGNWEQVKDLSDVLRIVSENIGSEFAQKVEEILEDYEYIGDE